MSTLSLNEVYARISEIKEGMAHLNNTLEGCDWCCGGGDERMAEYKRELDELDKLRIPEEKQAEKIVDDVMKKAFDYIMQAKNKAYDDGFEDLSRELEIKLRERF